PTPPTPTVTPPVTCREGLHAHVVPLCADFWPFATLPAVSDRLHKMPLNVKGIFFAGIYPHRVIYSAGLRRPQKRSFSATFPKTPNNSLAEPCSVPGVCRPSHREPRR